MTCSLKKKDIINFFDTITVTQFPVHAQSIERIIQEWIRASMIVYGADRSDDLSEPQRITKSIVLDFTEGFMYLTISIVTSVLIFSKNHNVR